MINLDNNDGHVDSFMSFCWDMAVFCMFVAWHITLMPENQV